MSCKQVTKVTRTWKEKIAPMRHKIAIVTGGSLFRLVATYKQLNLLKSTVITGNLVLVGLSSSP